MAYWVHVQKPEGLHWQAATEFDPPAPAPDGAKGYALLCVESRRFVFVFSSPAQLVEAIRVLSLKPLPTTRRLASARPGGHGPNSHWLSRLPASVKAPKARQRAVEDLSAVWRNLAAGSSSDGAPLRWHL